MDFSSFSEKLISKRNIISLLVLATLVLAIPLGVVLIRQQQILRAKALGDEIKFFGEGVLCDPNAAPNEVGCTTIRSTVRIEITSPFGPKISIPISQ